LRTGLIGDRSSAARQLRAPQGQQRGGDRTGNERAGEERDAMVSPCTGRQDARELAVALIAAYEGIALLAATLRDPTLISAEGDRPTRWIDSLK
jgi:hypothetical protein